MKKKTKKYIKGLENQLDNSFNENRRIAVNCKSLEQALAVRNETIELLAVGVRTYGETLKRVQEERTGLEERIQEQEGQIKRQADLIQKWQTGEVGKETVKDLERVNRGLEDRIKEQEGYNSDLIDTTAKLRELIDKRDSRIKVLIEDYRTLELNKALDEQTSTRRIKELEGQIAELEKSKGWIQSRLNTWTDENTKLKEVNLKLGQTIGEQKELIEKWRGEAATYHDELQSVKEDNNVIKNSNKGLVERVARWKAEVDEVQQTNSELRAEVAAQKEEIERLRTEAVKDYKTIQHLKGQLDHIKDLNA